MKMRMMIELEGNEKEVREAVKAIKKNVIAEISDRSLEGFDYKESEIKEKKEQGEIQIPSFMTPGQKGRAERKSIMVGRG